MVEKRTDFGVQADILDSFVHLSDLQSDPEGVRVVIQSIKRSPDLMRYFLAQSPSPEWAEIMYQEGLFDNPPPVVHVDKGYKTPPWNLSSYLASVASSAPDIVLRVFDQIDTDNPVVQDDLIRALTKIPADHAASRLEKIGLWLANPYSGPYWRFAESAAALMLYLAENERIHEAIEILDELTRPTEGTASKHGDFAIGGEASARFELSYQRPDFWHEIVPGLERLAHEQVVRVLERNLLLSLELEMAARGEGVDISSWRTFGWRSSIGDTAQDSGSRHKDKLLVALRGALERWVGDEALAARKIIEEYLRRDEIILRRLALFVLGQHPSPFTDLIESELTSIETKDDFRIHNEYFHILVRGFPILPSSAKSEVVSRIQQGPDIDRTRKLAERISEETGEDPAEYATRHRETWIRDRLWVIRDELPNRLEQKLDELLDRYGEPDHPEFLVWSYGARSVVEDSPMSVEEIASLPQSDLLAYLTEWKPSDRAVIRPTDAVQITRRGLAEAVSSVILNDPGNYEWLITQLATLSPEYSSVLFREASEALKSGADLPWLSFLDLAKNLAVDKENNGEQSLGEQTSAARLAAIRFIITGLEQRRLREGLLARVEGVLNRFLNDPDPDETRDRPEKGWLGYGDPATIALNSIRPMALIGLMQLISERWRLARPQDEHDREEDGSRAVLTPSLRVSLETKLDKVHDPSWAVHSVYGRFLPLLNAIDPNWVEKMLPRIFPQGDDARSRRYFAAAWDSYVIFNTPAKELFDGLREQCAHAIRILAKGEGTKTHLDPDQRLAYHVLMDYLWGPYDVGAKPGDSNLLGLFFSLLDDDARASAVWTLWKLGESMSEEDRENNWPAIARLWNWRSNETLTSQYPNDFRNEMARFAQIPLIAPRTESIVSLWPLLQSLLPYCKEFGAWRALEEFLASRVENSPKRCAKYYRLMHEQIVAVKDPHRSYSDTSDKILFTAAEDLSSRKDALAVMDQILRTGNQRYLEAYRTYTA